MLEFLAELTQGILELIVAASSKDGRRFLEDMGALLTGGEMKNHRRDGPVC
jgi:hypothetical protein